MVHRGWSAVATPAGWYEIIRGPPSVQWPKGKGKGNQDVQQRVGASGRARRGGARISGGRWKRQFSAVCEDSQSGRSSCCVWSPDSSAKMETESPPVSTQMPRVGAARDRVVRLEQAISVMGNSQGARDGCVGCFLKKAQIRTRKVFVEQAKKRIEQIDFERAAKFQSLEESQKRLEELRAVVPDEPVVPQFCRCQCRGEATPADGVGLALQGPVAPLVVSHFEAGGGRFTASLRSRRSLSVWQTDRIHEHGAQCFGIFWNQHVFFFFFFETERLRTDIKKLW